MEVYKIVYIVLIVFFMWYMKILYRNRWNEEAEINIKHIEFENKLIHNYAKKIDDIYTELTAKNENITRELLKRDKEYNKLLKQYNDLKKGYRKAKIIKEEKTDESI